MNKSLFRAIMHSTALFGALASCVGGDEPQAQPALELTLVLSAERIWPAEPLVVAARLRNPGTAPVTITSTWTSAVFVSCDDGQTWRIPGTPGPQATPLPPMPKTVHPGESVNTLVHLNIDRHGTPVFTESGTCLVRVRFAGYESLPARVEVIALEGNDRAAFEHVQRHELAPFFSEQAARVLLCYLQRPFPVHGMATLITEYPGSRYAHWATLAMTWKAIVCSPQPNQSLERTAEELQARARSLPIPFCALSWYAAGRVQQALGKQGVAAKLFQKAVATEGWATMEDEVRWATGAVITLDTRPDPIRLTERELAAAGYDYTELRQEQVQELRVFMYARDPDWAQAGPRSHHDEQQETARRMKQWFLKHLQPKDVSFSPDPISDLQDELKALGYDLTTMTEDQLRDYDEYVDGTLDKARAANPAMSDLEYLTLQAKLIKEWALTNLKPTLPPKTNDTSTTVAPAPGP